MLDRWPIVFENVLTRLSSVEYDPPVRSFLQADQRRKFLRCWGLIFSRARPSLTIESVNRLFKSRILPILDYCGSVFHRRGKGNEEGLDCLQRRAGRIVLNTAHLSTEQMFTTLGWDTLTRRREHQNVKLVEKCLKGMAPSYFSKYFQFKIHDIHDYDIRNKDKLVVNRVKLESTKRAFFL